MNIYGRGLWQSPLRNRDPNSSPFYPFRKEPISPSSIASAKARIEGARLNLYVRCNAWRKFVISGLILRFDSAFLGGVLKH
jgi:hypothetical protein